MRLAQRQRALPVDRLTEAIQHPAEQLLAAPDARAGRQVLDGKAWRQLIVNGLKQAISTYEAKTVK